MFGVEGLTGTLIFTILVAAFGSAFQHGYNTGVVNNPQEFIEDWIGEILTGSTNSTAKQEKAMQAKWIYSSTVSLYCIGGMIGGVLTNFWIRIFGMKSGVIANNFYIFLASILIGLSKSQQSYLMLILGRFFLGINSGLNAGLVPMYLSELPPKSMRGGVGSFYQLFVTISILISQILSMESILGGGLWPISFAVVILVPAIIQLVLLPFCADSPRYLHGINKEEDVQKALRWLRGTEDVQAEMEILKNETEAESKMPKVDYGQLMTNPNLRKPLIISCVIMLSQQFSGINAVIYYCVSSFLKAGLSLGEAQIGLLVMGAMNVAMTVISTMIVDIAGRKTLLIVGFILMIIDTILLCIFLNLANSTPSAIITYGCILCVVLFVVFFAIGLGSIPWFLVSELFLPSARPLAVSIAVPVNWLANAVVAQTFPSLQELLNAYVFIIFAILQLIFLIYIIVKVPETKNKTITEITAEFMPKK